MNYQQLAATDNFLQTLHAASDLRTPQQFPANIS